MPDCRCILCLAFEATCKECGRVFTTFPSFRSHEAAHARKRTRDALANRPQSQLIATRKSVIVPDKMGYLTKVVTDRDGLAAYNLAAISRFAAVVNEVRATRKRFTKGHKLLLRTLTGPDGPALVGLKCELPKDQAISTLQLALACGVSPEDVISLLVAYGFERLATELRDQGRATAPIAPTQPVVRTEKKPRTLHEEFLDEQFPEHAPPQKVVEIVEYRKPQESVSSVSRAIPSSSIKDEGDV